MIRSVRVRRDRMTVKQRAISICVYERVVVEGTQPLAPEEQKRKSEEEPRSLEEESQAKAEQRQKR